MIEQRILPHDRRGFVHKKLLGAALGFVGGGFQGAIQGFIGGGGGGANQVPGNEGGCPAGFKMTPDGRCVDATGGGRGSTLTRLPEHVSRPMQTSQIPVPGIIGFAQRIIPGGATGFTSGGGTAMTTSFGGVGQPGTMTVTRRICQRRHVLGADGLCYPKGAIKNADRWWPAPRRPLLTGGDLNAIATAARAARRLETATKRLQKMGMMKKPSRGRSRGRGGHTHQLVSGPAPSLRVISEETN